VSQIALPLDWPEDERDDQFILSDANAAVAKHLGIGRSGRCRSPS